MKSGHVIRDYTPRPQWDILAFDQIESLKASQPYSDLLTVIRSIPQLDAQFGKLVGTPKGSRLLEPANLVVQIMGTLLRQSGGVFSTERFDPWFARLWRDLTAQTIECEALSPLVGFEGPDEIRLSGDIRVRRLSEEELLNALSMAVVGPGISDDVILDPPTHAIVLGYALPKTLGQIDFFSEQTTIDRAENEILRVQDSIQEVVSGLRLFKRGQVAAGGAIHYHLSALVPGYYRYDALSTLAESRWGRKFEMSAAEAGQFVDLWAKMATTKSHKSMALAIKRFSMAQERRHKEDELVDLMICSEALFFGGSKNQGEQRFRLGVYAGGFLGDTPEEKASIAKEMRRAYDLRSKIVHGTGGAPLSEGDWELIGKTEERLRKAIMMVIDSASRGHPIDWESLPFGR